MVINMNYVKDNRIKSTFKILKFPKIPKNTRIFDWRVLEYCV